VSTITADPPKSSTSEFLSRPEAAKYLNLGQATLAAWAVRGTPKLRFTKLGAKVLYRKSDLDAFIEENSATSNSELAARR